MADETAAPEVEAEAPANEAQEQQPASLMDGAETKGAAPANDWPEDWREKLAGGDEKALNQFKRLGSPTDMARKLIEQEKLIRSGKHKAGLGENPTDEEVAEYRKANGIPEKPDGYAELLKGVAIGDDDKAGFEEFFAAAHEANMDPRAVEVAATHYLKMQEARAAAMAEADSAYRTESGDALREAMGPDFRANMNDLKAWLGSRDGMFEAFSGARGPDGRLLGDNPAVISFLVEAMREINPAPTVVPGTGNGAPESIEAELKKISDLRRTDRAAYNKDVAMQERERKLLDMQAKQRARAA